jgi:hypothetical protein
MDVVFWLLLCILRFFIDTYYLDPVNSKDNNSMKSTAKMNQYELEEEEDYYSLAK